MIQPIQHPFAASPFHDLLGLELAEWRLGFARMTCRNPDGRMVAFGASTHRFRAGSENPEGVPA